MRKFLLMLLVFVALNSAAQDIAYVRKTLSTLTSPSLWGRGYTKNGMEKSAEFIVSELKSFGLKPMQGNDFMQSFVFSVNTFPGDMNVNINGKGLIPGKDFIVDQASIGSKADVDLVQKDSVTFINPSARVIVSLADKLTWSVSQTVNDYTHIIIHKSSLTELPKRIKIDIENRYEPTFKASNICAMVKGTVKPDSVILITAHYDHLGGMGRSTYFPGANDNASGVAFLLSLAKYYANNPQKYTIAFICFAGEEAGILGSKYFTEHPLVNLQNIRFLFNVDMVGTGESGATVVNATQYPKEFNMLKKINDEDKLLVKINSRGKAANSDHYFFTEKGVPAFFLYTQGGISAYHDIFDKAETLPLSVYEKLFRLFLRFNQALMN